MSGNFNSTFKDVVPMIMPNTIIECNVKVTRKRVQDIFKYLTDDRFISSISL